MRPGQTTITVKGEDAMSVYLFLLDHAVPAISSNYNPWEGDDVYVIYLDEVDFPERRTNETTNETTT